MELVSTAIHIGDRVFGALVHPLLYFINRRKYKNYLGDYNAGKGIITIKYRFLDWGKFSIDGVEPLGERWEGKYRIVDNLIMTGTYQWNIGKNTGFPDTGEHQLIFSPDKTQVNVIWKNLTGSYGTGTVIWKKVII
jgi:hypothetical protein